MKISLKDHIWRLLNKGLGGERLLWFLLRMADRWGIKRNQDGICTFPFVINRKNRSFQIFYYHRVNDDHHPFFGGTRLNIFSAHMELLRNYFCVLPLEELMDRKARCDVPDRAVAITFDDGYKDNFTHAFPILKNLELPATIFLTTGAIESGNWLWHDHVFEAFHYTQAQKFVLENRTHLLTTMREKRMALHTTLNRLRELHPLPRNKIIQELVRQLDPQPTSLRGQDKLAWDDVKIMSEHNITFGAHTVSHPILSRLSFEEACREIMDSKEVIEKTPKQAGPSVCLSQWQPR